MSNGSANAQDIISLPQGGGAQRGIGETFAPDLQTGTGNFTVPVALPSGRNGFQPEINLMYSTGNGNGPFGLGWALSVPGISRKTSRGVPRYRDASTDPTDWDTFLLSSAEDLVPVVENGTKHYRPRTEGLFARIERNRIHGGDWWDVRSKDGLVSHYGTLLDSDAASGWRDLAALADPADPARIFAWKLSETYDPFGNRIVYDYRTEQDPAPEPRWVQTYLQRIRYIDVETGGDSDFLVSVTFDYEPRPDIATDHRAGFAIRTGLRCTAITVRTHAGRARTVRSYRLSYEQAPLNGISRLRQVQMVGADGVETLPPLEFAYTRFDPGTRHDLLTVTGPDAPPASLASLDYDLVDLSGDGLPDVIQLNGTARTWRNRGGGRFDRPTTMRDAPAGVALADPGVQLMDANGDGRVDLVVTREGIAGTWPLRFDGRWDRASFRKYRRAPSFSLEDPEVRLVDLDGDGVADLIRAGERLCCVFHDPEMSTWRDPVWLRRGALEDLPTVSFADPRVKWADLSGDGLQDLVIVHQGSVRYWPNQGHGAWAAPVTMAIPERLPWGYNPDRLLLGDVDGDGLADMVYVEANRVTLWVNRSGAGWSDPVTIEGTPSISDADAVRIVDLLGSGIGGLLYTADADLNGRPRANYHFLDFTGAAKPYLLNRMDNHLGAVTQVGYRASTVDYLRDAESPQTRWRTPLPFPVQVVGTVEVIDGVSRGKLTTEYRYHHGYWDGGEREFRGFAMVEQLDSEDFETYNRVGLHGEDAEFATVADRTRFSPPTLTKTWFDVGPVGDEFGEWDPLDLTSEYWQEDPPAFSQHPSVAALLRGLSERRDRRDAWRALRGRIVRTELYALDGSARQDQPYTVTEMQFGLREEAPPSPAEGDRRRIFFPFVAASRTTQWERGDDPMSQLSFTDRYDAFGQPGAQTSVATPRRGARRQGVTGTVVGALDSAKINETRILASHTTTVYTAPDAGLYLHDRVAQTRAFELTAPPGVTELNPADLAQVLRDQVAAALAVRQDFLTALDGWQAGEPIPVGLTLTGHTIHHYDGAAFAGRPTGAVGPYGALTRTEALVFTDRELNKAYGARRPVYLGGIAALPQGAPAGFAANLGYRLEQDSADGYHAGYYADLVRNRLDVQTPGAAQRRGLLLALQDPLGQASPPNRVTTIAPDPYWLLPVTVKDPTGLSIAADYNYVTLKPARVTDESGNAIRYAYSPLGLLLRVVFEGREGEGGTNVMPETLYGYDFHAYDRTRNDPDPQPIFVQTTQRIWHAADNVSDDTMQTREYSDGFGRLIQKRTQADETLFGADDNDAGLLVNGAAAPGQAGGAAVGRREPDGVIVSGWQVFDNKGQVIEQYEPFFDTGWDYQPEEEAHQGQRVATFYDPRGQVIRTLGPDGSESRVVFGVPPDLSDPDTFAPTPWEMYSYDANDLAPLSVHPTQTQPDGSPRTLAGDAPQSHHFTPTSATLDGQGRAVCCIERNGNDPAHDWFVSRFAFDLRGNLITVWDAMGRAAFRHAFDLLDRPLRVESIDAGTRTTVRDAAGSVVEFRDSKGGVVLREYDARNRPTQLWARDTAAGTLTLRERLEYGTASAEHRARNRSGRLYRHFDEAGLVQHDRYDFKGNLTEKGRRTIKDSALAAGWTANWAAAGSQNALEASSDAYRIATRHDALNRPVVTTYPRETAGGGRATVTGRYGRGGALERIEIDGVPYVERIAHNAKGQRLLIVYGNGTMTRYAYDARTFRLMRLRSERYQRRALATSDEWRGQGAPLQDLTYAYDLAGNTTSIEERTSGCGIAGGAEGRNRLTRRFDYDPLYRLTEASGRSCRDFAIPRSIQDRRNCGFHPPATPSPAPPIPNQTNAPDLTWRYTETYAYDPAGNLLETVFNAPDAPAGVRTWRREFGIGGLPPDEWEDAANNRLTRLAQGQETYTHTYDDNGNLTRQNTEREYRWDHADRLVGFTVQPPGATQPSIEARYLYGADGARVKKWVRNNGTGPGDSTVYLDGVFEHHRWKKPGQAARQNNHLHVIEGQGRIALLRRGPVHPDDFGPAIQYHLVDHLGSSGMVVDDSGNWINREEYFPYGETSFGGFARKRYRFTGKERDEESGLSYHGARYYAPWVMRWMSCDKAVSVDSHNLYLYVRCRPTVFHDDSGNKAGVVAEVIFETAPKAGVPAELAAPAVGIGTVLAVSAAVVGAFALWTGFYVVNGQRGGELADERIRRAAIAEDLRLAGLITWEEGNDYIRTGQLFIPRDRVADRSLDDAFRQRWFQIGRDFQQHVLETKLQHLVDRGLLEVEERIGTTTGVRKPDFARLDPKVPGAYRWVGDAKLGKIELDEQMKGLIDEASRTTSKTLIIFSPSETGVIPKSVAEHAEEKGVRILVVPVPFSPEFVPKVHGTTEPEQLKPEQKDTTVKMKSNK